MSNNIQLYRHVRLDKNEVFYVGIGKGDRPWAKRTRNRYWHAVANETEYRVDILFDDLTWEQACEKEREFIALYGRLDLGTGTLVNQTDGGMGAPGVVYTEEALRNMAAYQVGRAEHCRTAVRDAYKITQDPDEVASMTGLNKRTCTKYMKELGYVAKRNVKNRPKLTKKTLQLIEEIKEYLAEKPDEEITVKNIVSVNTRTAKKIIKLINETKSYH